MRIVHQIGALGESLDSGVSWRAEADDIEPEVTDGSELAEVVFSVVVFAKNRIQGIPSFRSVWWLQSY